MMKKQNLWWTILFLMMFLSMGTLQAQTTYKTQTYPDGTKYVGEWKVGPEHGHVTRTYSDGDEIKGVCKMEN